MASLSELFTNIANAIRAKTGSSASIVATDFPTAISNIPVGKSNLVVAEGEVENGTKSRTLLIANSMTKIHYICLIAYISSTSTSIVTVFNPYDINWTPDSTGVDLYRVSYSTSGMKKVSSGVKVTKEDAVLQFYSDNTTYQFAAGDYYYVIVGE